MKKGNHRKEVHGLQQTLGGGDYIWEGLWVQSNGPSPQTMGLGHRAGCSLCGWSPSLSWLQSRGRRSQKETELEIQVQDETRLRVAEATVAAVGIGEGRHSPGGFIGIMWRSNSEARKTLCLVKCAPGKCLNLCLL